jgi:hypothetical protein
LKTRLVFVLVFLTSIVSLALLLLARPIAPTQASPDLLYVAPGGSCGGPPNCYASVQAAVDAAVSGDEIRVATGVYTDVHIRPRHDFTTTGVVTQTVYVSKTVTIRGGYSAGFSDWNPALYTTTLDAQGQGRVFYIIGNISPTIEGLHVTGGDAAGLGGYEYYGTYDAGGGVYVMTATVALSHNQVFSNAATSGGGVFLGYSSGKVDGNTIFNNSVATGGGGVFLYHGSATLTGNTIMSNTSQNLGGGMYLFDTSAALNGNTISNNAANSLGGGVDVASCSPTFSGNVISGNAANKGGGIYLWYSRSVLTNNVIAGNQASATGSGLWIGGSQPRLLHTTVTRNTGGDGSGILVTDSGSGTYSTLAMTNTILVSHTTGISVNVGSTTTLNGILWFNTPVTVSHAAATLIVQNQYVGDPAFGPDGYHLTAGSAAIDKGVPAGVLTDIDGQPRPPTNPDLGADECWPPGFPKSLYLPVVMRN